MQRGVDRSKIKIDITKYNNENILLALETKKIIHLYSDNLQSKVKVYSLEEIISEKIRALFQRTRPRDLYDVWYLWSRVDKGKVLNILPEKCRFKDVKININNLEGRKDNFKNAWNNSLNHQLKILPDFDNVFFAVVEELKKVYMKIIKTGMNI